MNIKRAWVAILKSCADILVFFLKIKGNPSRTGEMMKRNLLGNRRSIQFGATFLALVSLLSLLAWAIRVDQNPFGGQKFQDEFEITMISKHTKMSEQIKEYCLKYGRDSREEDPDLSNFIVSEKYKLVYCSVPKVACTVWKRILANLEGLNITKGVHKYTKGKLKLLSNYSLEEREKILKTYKKFMFVREPFERLLSAYRDCFFGKFKTTVEYWKDYRKFIKEVLVNSSGHYNDSLPANDDLTFEQFSTYLVLRWRQGKRFQEHWREQYNLCHPCRIKFDFIGHYETLAEDALFILRKTNLEDKVFFPEWQPTDTSSLMQKYYSTLSLLRIKQLQNIYNKDFELFGYEYPGALQMIVDNLINDKL